MWHNNVVCSGRFGRADGYPAAGQAVVAGRCDLLGDRVRGAQPAGSLHQDIRVPRLDQPDPAVLAFLEDRRPEDILGSRVVVTVASDLTNFYKCQQPAADFKSVVKRSTSVDKRVWRLINISVDCKQ